MIKKISKKFLSPTEAVIFGKDFGMLWKYGVCRGALVGLTVLLAVFLPLVYFAAISAIPQDTQSNILQKLIPGSLNTLGYRQEFFYILLNMVLPMFFVLIPILSASLPASVFFIGEKEQGTAVTLLCTPCTAKEVFKSKFACATLNSWGITILAFICMAIIASVGNIYFAAPFFVSPAWIIEIFLLSPVLSALTVLLTYLLSGKYIYVVEAVMTCGYIAVPFLLMFIGQFAGLYRIGGQVLLGIAIAIAVADVFLYRYAVKIITAEKLI